MKTVTALLAAAIIGALTLLPSTAASAATPRIDIREIYYNSPGADTGSNASLNAEWVRLYNTTSSNISLTNWTLRDAQNHVYKFASYTLGAHRYLKIHTGRGTNTQTDRYWNLTWYIWNNTGDTATLRTPVAATVDSCRYTGTAAGYVYC
jgi:hypothetical protein